MPFCSPKSNWKPARYAGLICLTMVVLSMFVDVPKVTCQTPRKSTREAAETKPVSTGRVRRKTRAPRPTNPVSSTSPGVTESERFLELGNRFQEKERWNAAESAYKEAVKLWPRNAEALTELGYIYLNSNRIQEAHATAGKLQGVNPQYARELQSDIANQRAKR